jgi:hypothetical protein
MVIQSKYVQPLLTADAQLLNLQPIPQVLNASLLGFV